MPPLWSCRWLVVATALALVGCQAAHEQIVASKIINTRFFSRDVERSLDDVDAALISRHVKHTQWCELCSYTIQSVENDREYCVSSHEEVTCVLATAVGPKRTRFRPVDQKRVSAQVIRALWFALEPEAAEVNDRILGNEVQEEAALEEEQFVPRWSFVAGAKVGTVVSYDPPAFTFGGQVGFRYWGSLFVIPGAAIDVENVLQKDRTFITASPQGRIELALWRDENARFANLPSITFLMSGGPLFAFGKTPAVGGRATFGVHLVHLGPIVTPFFFELGFQTIEVDEIGLTGLRLSLGVGF